MENAFPADELMPLSCKGRYRGQEPNRGDIDDALGNFTLTLIDSLDTLVVLGDLEEFEKGVKLVIQHANFDHDISVSVFETNIRVVGGLISSHILAELLQTRKLGMSWYHGELLNLALDVGYRLLPSFNSTTGLPHPRVNLRHGIKAGKVKQILDTCTACAGTMILEFAALSRLSGEPIFEEKAKTAMDVLWSSRHRQSNLVGNVLNINTGDWIRRDSGVGAGIDSYYEYVAKAYVLLGDEQYLSRWNTHYSSIMKYLGQRPVMQDVHMHRPHTTSKHFIDALGAFWPGLQVLMGDVKPAIESHEILYQIVQRHDFIPEAFTSDFQIHWGQHLLRPEFVESTYFLYRATKDPYYLEAGEKVLRSLQKHARVICGYASIKDVRTMQQEDRMDSFVLAETFKYLYLLFSEDNDLMIDIDSFVFTTEGHLLPLSLARLSPSTAVPLKEFQEIPHDEEVEFALSCPSTNYLFPGNANYAQDIRSPLANMVANKCPTKKGSGIVRKLYASDFQSSNGAHLELVKNMGITIINLPDGRVQLLHTLANAKTPEDGEEGLLFMQEMIELSKHQSNLPATQAKVVKYDLGTTTQMIFAGPAQFGRELLNGFSVSGQLIVAEPIKACSISENAKEFWGKIVLVERGDCMFVEKARILEKSGAKGGIVVDNNKGTTATNSPLFSMSGDGTDDVSIPMVFMFSNDAKNLLESLQSHPKLEVTLMDSSDVENDKVQETKENGNSYDITSPVRSFLEKSKRQVENYIRDKLSLGEAVQVKDESEFPENAETLLISTDVTTGTIRGSVQDPNGNVYTVVKQPQQSKKTREIDLSEDYQGVVEEVPESNFIFDKLEDFLNPSNPAIKKLIEHHVIKKPTVLSELLTAKFSDLVTVFRGLMNSKVSTVEAAYLHLLHMVEEKGAQGIAKHAAELRNRNDELKEAIPNLEAGGSGEEDDNHMRRQSQDDFIAPTLRLIKGLENVLSDDDINAIIEKYLANSFDEQQGSSSKMTNSDNYFETHQQKAKAAAAIMDLISSTDPPENPHSQQSKKEEKQNSKDEL